MNAVFALYRIDTIFQGRSGLLRAAIRDYEELRRNMEKEIAVRVAEVCKFIRKWYTTLQPLLKKPLNDLLESVVADPFVRERVVLGCGMLLHVTLVVEFACNVIQLWNIKKDIQAAMEIVTDEQIKQQFARIEAYIGRLQKIVEELDGLFHLWEAGFPLEDFEDWDLYEARRLLGDINAKLALVNPDEYQEIIDMIGDLRDKVNRQHAQLEKCAENLKKLGIGGAAVAAGALAVSAALFFIPVVGPITAFAAGAADLTSLAAMGSGVTCGVGGTIMNQTMHNKLTAIVNHLNKLEDYERQLEDNWRRIEQHMATRDAIAQTFEMLDDTN